jgi:uncharacterized protein YcaQ
MRAIDRLGSLQFDPIDVAGRNHDLVLLARIAGYRREWTEDLLYRERRLYESYNKGLSILPTAEMPWYRITWDRGLERHTGTTFDEHNPLVEELLARIREAGPLSSTDVQARAAIEWYWRPTNQVRAILEALAEAGVLGIRRREGNRRVYDLAERLFPAELLGERRPQDEQRRHRLLSRFRAHGLLGTAGQAELWLGTAPGRDTPATNGSSPIPSRATYRAQLIEAGELVPVAVDGIRGERFVVAEDVGLVAQAEREVDAGDQPGGQTPGVAFLAPLDPLVWDRDLLRRLFAFDYVWEVYVPAARRRYGYYVLPILFGDRFVGRVELRFDRGARALRVVGLLWEPGFDPLEEPGFVRAFADALEAHRAFAHARRVVFPRTASHRPIVRAIKDVLVVA